MSDEKERAIFAVNVDPVRHVDPMVVRRCLLRLGKSELHQLMADSVEPKAKEGDDPQQYQVAVRKALDAQEKLLAIIRTAFDLPEISVDGSGHTEATVWRIWREWQGWLAEQKKMDETTPT